MSSTFPSSRIDALTMLYLEKQDLSNISPEELLDKYDEVYEQISSHSDKKGYNSNGYNLY